MAEVPSDASVAIVTGGGSGIGAATAKKLAADGYRVAVTGRRSAPIEAVAREVDGLAIVADASSADAARATVEATLERFGGLDLLVINHAISLRATVAEMTDELWDETLAVNLSGPFYLCRAALPALIEWRGSIVAVGSCAARQTWPQSGAYSISKVGLMTLMQTIACENGTRVRANTINPGTVTTSMVGWQVEALAEHRGVSTDDAWRAFTAAVPQRRPATPEEIAEAIAWLGSPAASYVNGATLDVDGGRSIIGAMPDFSILESDAIEPG